MVMFIRYGNPVFFSNPHWTVVVCACAASAVVYLFVVVVVPCVELVSIINCECMVCVG